MMMMMNCFCGMVDGQKACTRYFHLGPLSEIFIIKNLQHVASRMSKVLTSETNFSERENIRNSQMQKYKLFYISSYIFLLEMQSCITSAKLVFNKFSSSTIIDLLKSGFNRQLLLPFHTTTLSPTLLITPSTSMARITISIFKLSL